jgi:hypothetical protein
MVAISVKKNGQSSKVVLRTKDIAEDMGLLSIPNGKSIAEQCPRGTVNAEINNQLPVSGITRLNFYFYLI